MIKTNSTVKPKLNRSPVTCPGLACFHGYTQPTDTNMEAFTSKQSEEGNTWIIQQEYQTKFIPKTSRKSASTHGKYLKIHKFIQPKCFPQASLHLPPAALSCPD